MKTIELFLEKNKDRELFEILKDEHPQLRAKNEEILDFRLLPKLKNKLVKTMRAANGMGLAAPQVGLNVTLFIMDVVVGVDPVGDPIIHSMMFVNPKIKNKIGLFSVEEGCLSVSNLKVRVPRSESILIEFWDEFGKKRTASFGKIYSICAQHEYDHLQGKLMTDYLPDKE